ncbi:MAG: DUF362 domain-containing protein [Chloroflexi bacterium]|nr:DUF362 domain-containing protein [Chloroflexota bacterium]
MLTRRDFLRRSILVTMGAALASCAPTPTPAPAPASTSVPAPINPPAPTATRAPATNAPAPTSAPVVTMTATPVPPSAVEPHLVVARGAVAATIARAAVDALGGMKKFVKTGNDVIIKPNICNSSYGPEYATTTNPDVIAELVKLCLEAGAKRVRVMDNGFSGSAVEGYKRSGIREAVEKAGGQMEIMSASKYANVALPNARDIKTWGVYQDILKADVVINVPIAKHHGSAQVTLAMKGLMGVIQDRNGIHLSLDQRIADLSTLIKPTLNIVDGIRVLTSHGPTGGRLDYVRQDNTIIASVDPVAADGYATQLFFKKKPESIGYIKYAAEMGLGSYDFAKLRVKEVTA